VSPATIDNSSGNLVTVEGIGFGSEANVMIGPSFVSRISSGSTFITVRVPAGFPRGTHDVSVFNPDGAKTTLKAGLSVTGTSDSPEFTPLATPQFTPTPSPTPTPTDNIPPTISNIHYENLATSSVRIKWNTSEPAISRLDYGADVNNLNQTSWTTVYTTNQEVFLSGLSPDTTYSYRVHSKDTSGNLSFAPALDQPILTFRTFSQ
jgi:hypothetical protein